MRLLLLGLDNAGKTTIVNRLLGKDVLEVSPTLGFNVDSIERLGCKVVIWDIGGQTTLRTYWKNYFDNTDGLIWVVDSTDALRLQTCKRELATVLREERLTGASVMLLANKQDLAEALKPEEVAEALGLDAADKQRHWALFACSAKSGANVSTALDWIVKDICTRVHSEYVDKDSV
ncbi:MAG: hypothetical protein KVP17_001986 [Porospora cf. gigantea B]|uniref:uncharacterized protein n=2 Tax=Porospora cf. gigantea B TaxID=2853592 RepID=UPI003571A8C3|nr:MAG: hypothetical protein KVP17_001986 [Porospora cf. gigantea B]